MKLSEIHRIARELGLPEDYALRGTKEQQRQQVFKFFENTAGYIGIMFDFKGEEYARAQGLCELARKELEL